MFNLFKDMKLRVRKPNDPEIEEINEIIKSQKKAVSNL